MLLSGKMELIKKKSSGSDKKNGKRMDFKLTTPHMENMVENSQDQGLLVLHELD